MFKHPSPPPSAFPGTSWLSSSNSPLARPDAWNANPSQTPSHLSCLGNPASSSYESPLGICSTSQYLPWMCRGSRYTFEFALCSPRPTIRLTSCSLRSLSARFPSLFQFESLSHSQTRLVNLNCDLSSLQFNWLLMPDISSSVWRILSALSSFIIFSSVSLSLNHSYILSVASCISFRCWFFSSLSCPSRLFFSPSRSFSNFYWKLSSISFILRPWSMV